MELVIKVSHWIWEADQGTGGDPLTQELTLLGAEDEIMSAGGEGGMLAFVRALKTAVDAIAPNNTAAHGPHYRLP